MLKLLRYDCSNLNLIDATITLSFGEICLIWPAYYWTTECGAYLQAEEMRVYRTTRETTLTILYIFVLQKTKCKLCSRLRRTDLTKKLTFSYDSNSNYSLVFHGSGKVAGGYIPSKYTSIRFSLLYKVIFMIL